MEGEGAPAVPAPVQHALNPPAAPARPPGPITLDVLRTAFHQPREQAAETLGLSVNELKKTLKQLGVARWPYRKLASLQSLHQDLEQQLQQFAPNASDPAIAAHIKDLQEMQARITEDTNKIMQDPNHPLDEGLHKLRLQNYKARFLGKHGLSNAPPMLKMPASLAAAAAAAAEPSASGGTSGGGLWGPQASGDAGEDAAMSSDLTGTGRRRRAASIAASNSIKRAAGLVSAESDEEDELCQPSSQRSRPTLPAGMRGARGGSGGGAGGGYLMHPGMRSLSLGRPGLHAHVGLQGPATLATLPSLPEGMVFQEELLAQARMAQSAPLYDETQLGSLAALQQRAGSGMLSSLNDGVAAISLQQQQQLQRVAMGAGANVGPQFVAGQGGGTSGGGARSTQFHSRQLGVPQHLLPQPNSWLQAPALPHQQQGLQQAGGMRYTSAPVMQFTSLPGGQQQHASNASLHTDVSCTTQYAALQSGSQPSLLSGTRGGPLHPGAMQAAAFATQPLPGRMAGAAQSMPTLQAGAGSMYAGQLNVPRGPGGRPLPTVEPLVTPLEELLDEMMAGNEVADFAGELAARQQASMSALQQQQQQQQQASMLLMQQQQQQGGAAASAGALGMQPGFQMQAAGARGQHGMVTTGVPRGGHSMQVMPSGPAASTPQLPVPPASATLPNTAGPASVGGAGEAAGGPMQAAGNGGPASLRRMGNSSLFLLNSDDEDDAMLSNLLSSPAAAAAGPGSRLMGGSAHAMTASAMDARGSMLLAQQQAQLELRRQQLVEQEQQLRRMQQELAAQQAQLQQQQQHWAGVDASASMPASCPAFSTHVAPAQQQQQVQVPGNPSLHTISASPRPAGGQSMDFMTGGTPARSMQQAGTGMFMKQEDTGDQSAMQNAMHTLQQQHQSVMQQQQQNAMQLQQQQQNAMQLQQQQQQNAMQQQQQQQNAMQLQQQHALLQQQQQQSLMQQQQAARLADAHGFSPLQQQQQLLQQAGMLPQQQLQQQLQQPYGSTSQFADQQLAAHMYNSSGVPLHRGSTGTVGAASQQHAAAVQQHQQQHANDGPGAQFARRSDGSYALPAYPAQQQLQLQQQQHTPPAHAASPGMPAADAAATAAAAVQLAMQQQPPQQPQQQPMAETQARAATAPPSAPMAPHSPQVQQQQQQPSSPQAQLQPLSGAGQQPQALPPGLTAEDSMTGAGTGLGGEAGERDGGMGMMAAGFGGQRGAGGAAGQGMMETEGQGVGEQARAEWGAWGGVWGPPGQQ